MANQNQTQPTSTNKGNYTWSYKDVAQKDLNGNQWPFAIVRNIGRPGKMECRSMSSLEKSFEGTPYNLNDNTKGMSRYGCICKYLDTHKDFVGKITHLIIGFNSIYVKIEGEAEPRGKVYRDALCDVNRILDGVDYKIGATKAQINATFDEYRKTKDPNTAKILKAYAMRYVDMRKKMRILDSNRTIASVLRNPDYTFSSLKYLVFLLPKDGKSVSYRDYVEMALNRPCEELQSLETECADIGGFVQAMNAGKQFERLSKIEKIYCIPDTIMTDNKGFVSNFFKEVESDRLDNYKVYQSAKTSSNSKDAEQEKTERKEADKEKYKAEFIKEFKVLKGVVQRILGIIEDSNLCYSAANNVERDIWAEYLDITNPGEYERNNKLRASIQAEYDYKREVQEINTDEIYNFRDIYSLGSVICGERFGDNMHALFHILPTYFKDGRKTLSSMNVGFSTSVDTAKNSVVVIRKMRKQMIDFFEVFLGCYYGIFGVYMKRFMHVFPREQAIDLAIQLMPSIKTGAKLTCSKNVLAVAERFIYRDLGCSLMRNSETFYDSLDMQTKVAPYKSFCKVAIDRVNGLNTPLLTHSDESTAENKDAMREINLIQQYESVKFMIEQYKVFFKI